MTRSELTLGGRCAQEPDWGPVSTGRQSCFFYNAWLHFVEQEPEAQRDEWFLKIQLMRKWQR